MKIRAIIFSMTIILITLSAAALASGEAVESPGVYYLDLSVESLESLSPAGDMQELSGNIQDLPVKVQDLLDDSHYSGDMTAQSAETSDFQIVGYTNLPELQVGLQGAGSNYRVYYVQPGDSLYRISRRFNTTVSAIRSINNLSGNMIYVGQRLLIPAAEAEKPEQYSTEIIYFVQPGDSLYLIANRFGTTVGEIVSRNNLDSYYIQVGKMLFIKTTLKNLPSLPGMEVVYYVKPGDTLYRLALRYNSTVDKIMARNNLLSDVLNIGQKLYIPLAGTGIPERPNFVIPYTVEFGDTLVTIGKTFEMTPRELIIFNGLKTDNVYPGQQLQVPLSVPQDELGDGYQTTDDHKIWLTRITYGEARGEPFRGQVAVAAVVLNRVKHPYFPNTIESVVFQPWQFSPVQDGQIWLEPEEHARSAATAAMKGWDPSRGAIYFYNPGTSTSDWIFYRNVIVKIGDHYFAV